MNHIFFSFIYLHVLILNWAYIFLSSGISLKLSIPRSSLRLRVKLVRDSILFLANIVSRLAEGKKKTKKKQKQKKTTNLWPLFTAV